MDLIKKTREPIAKPRFFLYTNLYTARKTSGLSSEGEKMDTFIDLFETNVRDHRDNTAVLDPVTGISLTYGELDALAGRLAAKLQAGGVEKGDTIAVVLPHSIDSIASILAGMKAGAAVAPLNGRMWMLIPRLRGMRRSRLMMRHCLSIPPDPQGIRRAS